jgi:hypothetical protein
MREQLKVMERTQHLLVWHDLSTVANHSQLVFMATCLYDQATFYTNSEYEGITGKKVNIQSLVEALSHPVMKINCVTLRPDLTV